MIWGWDALPDKLNPYKNPNAWKGTDTEWKRWVKGLQAFRFEGLPRTLFAARGRGPFRWENSDGSKKIADYADRVLFRESLQDAGYYLSRIQYWTRWHVQLQWPLFFAVHVYHRPLDVPMFPNEPREDLSIKRMFSFQIGFKRDGDGVSWLTMFLGGRWE